MYEIFKCEFARYRNLVIGIVVLQALLYFVMHQYAPIRRLNAFIYFNSNGIIALFAMLSLAFGQFHGERSAQSTAWIPTIHRPLAPHKIGVASVSVGLLIVLIVTTVPLFLFLSFLRVSGQGPVEITHFYALFQLFALCCCAYLSGLICGMQSPRWLLILLFIAFSNLVVNLLNWDVLALTLSSSVLLIILSINSFQAQRNKNFVKPSTQVICIILLSMASSVYWKSGLDSARRLHAKSAELSSDKGKVSRPKVSRDNCNKLTSIVEISQCNSSFERYAQAGSNVGPFAIWRAQKTEERTSVTALHSSEYSYREWSDYHNEYNRFFVFDPKQKSFRLIHVTNAQGKFTSRPTRVYAALDLFFDDSSVYQYVKENDVFFQLAELPSNEKIVYGEVINEYASLTNKKSTERVNAKGYLLLATNAKIYVYQLEKTRKPEEKIVPTHILSLPRPVTELDMISIAKSESTMFFKLEYHFFDRVGDRELQSHLFEVNSEGQSVLLDVTQPIRIPTETKKFIKSSAFVFPISEFKWITSLLDKPFVEPKSLWDNHRFFIVIIFLLSILSSCVTWHLMSRRTYLSAMKIPVSILAFFGGISTLSAVWIFRKIADKHLEA